MPFAAAPYQRLTTPSFPTSFYISRTPDTSAPPRVGALILRSTIRTTYFLASLPKFHLQTRSPFSNNLFFYNQIPNKQNATPLHQLTTSSRHLQPTSNQPTTHTRRVRTTTRSVKMGRDQEIATESSWFA
jgi:hypothetical protein